MLLYQEKKSRPKQALQLNPETTGFFKENISKYISINLLFRHTCRHVILRFCNNKSVPLRYFQRKFWQFIKNQMLNLVHGSRKVFFRDICTAHYIIYNIEYHIYIDFCIPIAYGSYLGFGTVYLGFLYT